MFTVLVAVLFALAGGAVNTIWEMEIVVRVTETNSWIPSNRFQPLYVDFFFVKMAVIINLIFEVDSKNKGWAISRFRIRN